MNRCRDGYIRGNLLGILGNDLNNDRSEPHIIYTANIEKMNNEEEKHIIFHRSESRLFGPSVGRDLIGSHNDHREFSDSGAVA